MTRQLVFRAVFALAILAFPLASRAATPITPLSPADKALVDQASAYLEGLGQVRGHFSQTDAHGVASQGELYLSRPGKARFDYASPASLLVISDGHTVLVYDRRLKTFDRYPLGATPLSLFLQRHVRIDEKVAIARVERTPDSFSITATDGRHQTQGRITLTFASSPIALKEWSILDAQGARTTVRIGDLEPAASLDPDLFVLPRPVQAGPR